MSTSSGGAGATPTATRYRRNNKAGGMRLGAGASPGPAAGKATPGMTSPTGTGLVPAGPPCYPVWSTDPGATSTDPDDDMLTLVRDALLLPLASDRDALELGLGPGRLALVPATSTTPGPPPGDKVGTGDSGPGSGSHGDKVCTSGTRQGGGGDTRADSPSPGRRPSSSLIPWTTRDPNPTILLLPTDHPRAGSRSAPGPGQTAAGHARYPPRPAGRRRVVTRRRLGNRLGCPGTVHAEKGAMSHYASQPTPLCGPGGRWCTG